MPNETKTINIDKQVAHELKLLGIVTGKKYSDVIASALSAYIGSQSHEVRSAVSALKKLPTDNFVNKTGWASPKPGTSSK